MFKSILKLEILNKAVNNIDKETEETKSKVNNQKDEKFRLEQLIKDEEDKLASLKNKAYDLSERLERLKKGNMKIISNEIDQYLLENQNRDDEIKILTAELDSQQKHYDQNKIDLDFQKKILTENETDKSKDIDKILNNPDKKKVVDQLNEKIKAEKKLQIEKQSQIKTLE